MPHLMGIEDPPRAEQALLRSLIDNLPNCAAALFDTETRILTIGGELLKRYGYIPDRFEGLTFPEIFAERDRAIATSWCERALKGEHVSTSWQFRDAALFITVRPVYGADGVIVGGMALGQDMKDVLVVLEGKLREERQRIELAKELELVQVKAKMIERILHEFRNPLATLASSADILHHYGDTMPPEKHRQHINRIADEVRRLSTVLDDILTMMD